MDGFMLRLIKEMKKRPYLWNRNHEHFGCKVVNETGWQEVGKALKRDKTYVKRRWKNLSDTFKKELKNSKVVNGKEVYDGCWRLFDAMSFARDFYLQTIKARRKWQEQRTVVQNLNESSTESHDNTALSQTKNKKPNEKSKEQHEENTENYISKSKDESKIKEFDYSFVKEEFDTEYNTEKNVSTTNEHADEVYEVLSENEDNVINSREELLIGKETRKRKASETLTAENANVDDDVHFMMSLVPYLRRFNPVKKLLIRNEIQSLLIKELLCDNCRYGDKPKPVCTHGK